MTRSHLRHSRWGTGAAIGALAVLGTTTTLVYGSSHSDAPRIKQDPQANLTDVYAFVGSRYDDRD